MQNDDIFYDCRKISPEQKQLIDKEESRRNNNGNCTKNVVVSNSNTTARIVAYRVYKNENTVYILINCIAFIISINPLFIFISFFP